MIPVIDMNNIKNIDLNLLKVLLVILEEKNVTRASKRLHRGQPAISAALGRLRVLFQDELLVRSGRTMIATPKAEALQNRLTPLMKDLEDIVFEIDAFDPSVSDRVFKIGLPDDQETTLLQPVVAALSNSAPNARLIVRPTTYETVSAQIDNGDFDLAVTVLNSPAKPWQQIRTVGHAKFWCLFNPRLVEISAPISVDAYTGIPHVLVSFDGQFSGIVDKALETTGRTRNIQTVVPRFSALPRLLNQLPLMATVPDYVASHYAKEYDLICCPAPIPTGTYRISMIWHKQRDGDQGDIWLRSCVQSVASKTMNTPI